MANVGQIYQPHDRIPFVAPSNLSVGDLIVTPSIVGYVASDVASGATGALVIDGTFDLPADTSTAFDQGDELQWDGSKLIKQTNDGSASTAAYSVGCCVIAKASSSATARVRLYNKPTLPKGIRTLTDGQSACTVTVPDGLGGRPVLVSVASAAGVAWTASTAVAPAFKAAISSTTLTITMVDPVTGSAKAAGTGATIKLAYAVL